MIQHALEDRIHDTIVSNEPIAGSEIEHRYHRYSVGSVHRALESLAERGQIELTDEGYVTADPYE